ncbi:MAG: transposase [Oligoflexales bacterium]
MKSPSRPTYSVEFREAAVAKCLEIGVTETCQQLGVSLSTLNGWKKKYGSQGSSSGTIAKPSYEDLELEVKKLKKELTYVSQINQVLKKSTAIFCAEQMEDLR